MVLAAVKAVMHMGHSDLRLFLSLDLSALFSSASAPFLALCYPCCLCLDTVFRLLVLGGVYVSHSSNLKPQSGGRPWRGL